MVGFLTSSTGLIATVVAGAVILALLHLLMFLAALRACWKHQMQSTEVATLLRASRPRLAIRLCRRHRRKSW